MLSLFHVFNVTDSASSPSMLASDVKKVVTTYFDCVIDSRSPQCICFTSLKALRHHAFYYVINNTSSPCMRTTSLIVRRNHVIVLRHWQHVVTTYVYYVTDSTSSPCICNTSLTARRHHVFYKHRCRLCKASKIAMQSVYGHWSSVTKHWTFYCSRIVLLQGQLTCFGCWSSITWVSCLTLTSYQCFHSNSLNYYELLYEKTLPCVPDPYQNSRSSQNDNGQWPCTFIVEVFEFQYCLFSLFNANNIVSLTEKKWLFYFSTV